ncbi:MAG: glycosyltransferase family 2 protein [Chloroflexi bacterium]|nr:glycosyltransferase family 2 protein [Chloroflexota bacterium]
MSQADNTTVDVVIPVYNEERDLEPSVMALRAFLKEHCRYAWRIVVADNASKDRTLEIAKDLSQRFPDVTYIHLTQKGRGRALRTAWLVSKADIVSYMDVDLSTNLKAFMPMIEGLIHQGHDVATGSRLMAGSRTRRQWKREIISRCYNLLIKLIFPGKNFSDAQCGFKALTRRAVQELVPMVRDQAWFFDSELLLRAEQRGFRIYEVPVEWIEDLDSRVKIVSTAWEDIKGLLRVRFTSGDGQRVLSEPQIETGKGF